LQPDVRQPKPRYGSNDHRNGSAHSNENYYAVIVSIEDAIAGTAVGDAMVGHEVRTADVRQDVYFIRIRLDDRSYQTVTQTGLDGLRVGDSVRIEHDRVRRY
jgi:outer membrane lipoprotein SlyB